jgi:SAM-dependent methyltransferase
MFSAPPWSDLEKGSLNILRSRVRDSSIDTFKEKWENNRLLAFEETLREGSDIFSWILERNGFASGTELEGYLKGKNRVLDAGCGNGRVTALLRRYAPRATEIVGIDLISPEIARENLQMFHLSDNVHFLKKDLSGDLADLGKFDFIYCQEVLHHLSDPEQALHNLCSLLSSKGEIAVYVYRKKAPVREFVDDYVRSKISGLAYEEAMRACKQITELGRSLSQRRIKIQVPRVDLLEIEEGEYDLQRFIYHFFAKCFWNPDLSFLENAAINFDWYHPQIASRHTLEEVREWFIRAKLRITHEHLDFYGITLRGKRA